MSTQLQDSLNLFIFLALELSILFLGISLLVGVLQRHIPPKKIETLLSANKSTSYFLAAGLGAITPFCSCSTIPMLKGLIRAQAGFGPMMVFLFTSPLLNPIIVALLFATFSATLTFIYISAALCISLIAGWLFQVAGFDRYIRKQDCESIVVSCCSPQNNTTSTELSSTEKASCSKSIETQKSSVTSCCSSNSTKSKTQKGKYHGLWKETWADFMSVLPYLLIGISIGSLIYGFIPTSFIEHYAGANNPFAIPVAAVIGVPLYIRAEAVIPLASVLMGKGISAGAVLALIIGSAGTSLTELILLRSLFKVKLLCAFVIVIFTMAILSGYSAFLFYQ